MNQGNITILDVAREAEVSRQTVSRVINRSINVRPAVRERVEEAISDLGYVPNTAARRMGGARSRMLLGVVEQGAAAAGVGARTGRLPLDALVLAGIETCSSSGYHILFEQLDADAKASLAQFNRALTALSPDGVILTPPLDDRKDLQEALTKRGIAVEFLGERVEYGRHVPGIDDQALGGSAAEYLISLGHRQIGFIAGKVSAQRSRRRLAGFSRQMASAGCRAHHHFVSNTPLSYEATAKRAGEWLEPTIRPTAIIAETEEVAIAILEAASGLGRRVPDDLSILTLEDRVSLTRSKPPISAIVQPYAELFSTACERLIQQAENTGSDRQTAEFPLACELIERSSIGRAPRSV